LLHHGAELHKPPLCPRLPNQRQPGPEAIPIAADTANVDLDECYDVIWLARELGKWLLAARSHPTSHH